MPRTNGKNPIHISHIVSKVHLDILNGLTTEMKIPMVKIPYNYIPLCLPCNTQIGDKTHNQLNRFATDERHRGSRLLVIVDYLWTASKYSIDRNYPTPEVFLYECYQKNIQDVIDRIDSEEQKQQLKHAPLNQEFWNQYLYFRKEREKQEVEKELRTMVQSFTHRLVQLNLQDDLLQRYRNRYGELPSEDGER
jgi:hypothetical protein